MSGTGDKETVVNTLAISSAAAGGLAAYAAWFGPAAASVSIGGALAAFVPPVALAAGLGAATKVLLDKRSRALEMQVRVDDFIGEVRNWMWREVWQTHVKPEVKATMDGAVKQLMATHPRAGAQYDVAELRQFASRLEGVRVQSHTP